MDFTAKQIELIKQALAAQAARHESMERFRPRAKTAKGHAMTAQAMRELRDRLIKMGKKPGAKNVERT